MEVQSRSGRARRPGSIFYIKMIVDSYTVAVPIKYTVHFGFVGAVAIVTAAKRDSEKILDYETLRKFSPPPPPEITLYNQIIFATNGSVVSVLVC